MGSRDPWKLVSPPLLPFQYYHMGCRKTVEVRRISGGVSAKLRKIDIITFFQIFRQHFVAHDDVHGIACRARYGTRYFLPAVFCMYLKSDAFHRFHQAMEHARVQIHPTRTLASCAPHHAAHQMSSIRYHESPWLSNDANSVG